MGKIATGLIRSSHGVRGFLKVFTYSGEHQHLMELKEVTVKHGSREKIFSVEEVKPFQDGALIKLQGIDSPEEGRIYSNWEIWVERSDAAKLSAGEYYYADLCGSDVVCGGEVVARVVSVGATAASELLEVANERGTFFIPFVDEFIGEVSVEEKTIELKERRLVE